MVLEGDGSAFEGDGSREVDWGVRAPGTIFCSSNGLDGDEGSCPLDDLDLNHMLLMPEAALIPHLPSFNLLQIEHLIAYRHHELSTNKINVPATGLTER